MELTPLILGSIVIGYFIFLLIISFVTGKKTDNDTFFTAGHASPWYLVAFGMIGATLSGVTFISIPGKVGDGGLNMAFSYMQVVLGYIFGYVVIAEVLMPIYYREKVTSIYQLLGDRIGFFAHKTGSAFFLLSRTIGASLRLFLVAYVLHIFILSAFGISFALTVALTILLIWIYTFRSGIKTIVYTDTLQTFCLLLAAAWTVYSIFHQMDWDITTAFQKMEDAGYTQIFFFENGWSNPNNFFKQFLSGALITIVMTGLDQDMMQKNLSCKNIKEAKRNMYSFTIVLVLANLLFLCLGAMLYIYAQEQGIPIPERTDRLFPELAFNYLSPVVGLVFILGLIAAAYSSADSALTSLTTAFCIDFLNFKQSKLSEKQKKNRRWIVHIGFSILLFIVILIFYKINNDAVINQLFIAAGYTYGPILGLFVFAIWIRKPLNSPWVLLICLLCPVVSYVLNLYSKELFNGLQFGFLILLVNGLLTLGALYLYSRFQSSKNE